MLDCRQLTLKGISRDGLVDYMAGQLDAFFPDAGRGKARTAIARDVDEALDRLQRCINAVRMWRENEFDYLHSSQHCLFTYYLANTIWRNREDALVCTKLFGLNKALHGFDCFYNTELPEKMFIGHSVGIVLARVTYGNHLVLYQGCTVGKNHGREPVLEDGVVLYPHSAVIGGCRARAGTIVAQGSSIVDADTPGDCYVFRDGPRLVFKPPKRDVLADFFRN